MKYDKSCRLKNSCWYSNCHLPRLRLFPHCHKFLLKFDWLKQFFSVNWTVSNHSQHRRFYCNLYRIIVSLFMGFVTLLNFVSVRNENKSKKKNTGRPRAMCGQWHPLPCFAWLWIWVRGSRAAAPKGTKSCRTQGDFRLSVRSSIRPSVRLGWIQV